MRRRSAAVLAATMLMAMAGCSGRGGTGGSAEAPTDPNSVSGDITVLTHKTDLAGDGTLQRYADEFKKTYPKVNVKFEPIVDYEGDVKIRMNSDNYGDVLMIPGAIPVTDYPKFFAPLGDFADFDKKYRFADKGTVDGKVYGVAINGNASGILYNKAVWQQAGITKWPTTTDEFRAALRAVKAKTSAVPFGTIYHEGWPLTQWQAYLGQASCDTKANDNLATDTAPWAAGKELRGIDTLLYDVVHDKLTERDPTTATWDGAKTQIATGKTATLALGSWAISQMQDTAKKAGADPANIGYLPYPTQKDGHFCSVIGADYLQGVSIHSQHKEAARAWLDWFVDKSTYAQDEELLPTLKSGAMPPLLKAYQDGGVEFIQLSQEKNAQVSKIDNESEVGLNKPDYRQHIVDLARGAAGGGLDAYFEQLNKKWAAGLKSAG
ncbi:ABC transporter substrate-binding protein [Micromonospora zhanjiangensis]|uniref:ABC transporter substrate-binding protein n=1 Tax=Micromonospora zhanjiangensis TaxID=1522057 RepID=A0ABV8KID5_9ACTN